MRWSIFSRNLRDGLSASFQFRADSRAQLRWKPRPPCVARAVSSIRAIGVIATRKAFAQGRRRMLDQRQDELINGLEADLLRQLRQLPAPELVHALSQHAPLPLDPAELCLDGFDLH